MHSLQLRQQSQHPEHTFHRITLQTNNHRRKKQIIYNNNNNHSTNYDTNAIDTTEQLIKPNMKLEHLSVVTNYKNTVTPNKVRDVHSPPMCKSGTTLPRTHWNISEAINNHFCIHTWARYHLKYTPHHSVLSSTCIYTTMHIFSNTHIFQHVWVPTVSWSLRVRLQCSSRNSRGSLKVCGEALYPNRVTSGVYTKQLRRLTLKRDLRQVLFNEIYQRNTKISTPICSAGKCWGEERETKGGNKII